MKRNVNSLIAFTMIIAGVVILAVSDWRIAIGVLILFWGQNIQVGEDIRKEAKTAVSKTVGDLIDAFLEEHRKNKTETPPYYQ